MRNAKDKTGYMAIKLNLEKAYDILSWQFVIDSLKDLGLNNQHGIDEYLVEWRTYG